MSKEIILGIARHVLTLIGGYFVAHGKLDPGSAETIVGSVISLIGVGWSVKVKM